MTVVEQMEALARKYHEGQMRKDGKTPYIVHPAAVVARLRSWGVCEADGDDAVVSLAVAWGHDLLEDTKAPEAEILAVGELGGRILAGIKQLTFTVAKGACPDDERDKAKALYIQEVARTAPPEILVVKLADRLCNTEDFLSGFGRDRALAYLQKGAELIVNARRLDRKVEDACLEDAGAILRRLLDDDVANASLLSSLGAKGMDANAVRSELEKRIGTVTSSSMLTGGSGRWDVQMAILLHRIDLLRAAAANGADLDYRGYDGECVVHDILDSAFDWEGDWGNVDFAREALRLVVALGLGNLIDYADHEGYTPGYLVRRNPTAVALLAEFVVKSVGDRFEPAPWKDEAYEQFVRKNTP